MGSPLETEYHPEEYIFVTNFLYNNETFKLYTMNQSTFPISWDRLENTYVAVDKNNVVIAMYPEGNPWGSFFGLCFITCEYPLWIKPPESLPNDIRYDESFGWSCYNQAPTISQMAKNTTFTPHNTELVMIYHGNTFYKPTNADTLLRNMYDYYHNEKGDENSKNKTISYDTYVNRMYSVLIWKDIFGKYRLIYRNDHPKIFCG